jgi:plasmid maintenance system antidote protein VapI
MDLNDYLNQAKTRLALDKDSDLARSLHITRSGLSRMRVTGSISDDTADKLSEILNIEPAVVLLNARAAKSHNRRVVASVRRLLQQAGVAGIVFAAVDHAARCILCKMKEQAVFPPQLSR